MNNEIKLTSLDKNLKYVVNNLEQNTYVFSDDIRTIAESINGVSYFTIGFIVNLLKRDSDSMLEIFTGYNENELASLKKAFTVPENVVAITEKMKSIYNPTVARQQFSNAEIQTLLGNFMQDVKENYQNLIVLAESTNNGAEASKYVEFNAITDRNNGNVVGYKTSYYFTGKVTATWYAFDKVYGDSVPKVMFKTLEEFHTSINTTEQTNVDQTIGNETEDFEFSPSGRYAVHLKKVTNDVNNVFINPIYDTRYDVKIGKKETDMDGNVLYFFDDYKDVAETFKDFENMSIVHTYKIDSDGAEYSETGKLNVEPVGNITTNEGIIKRSIKNNSANLGDDKYLGVCEIDLSTQIRTYIDNSGHSFENINDLERHLITNFGNDNQANVGQTDNVLETSETGKLVVDAEFTINEKGMEVRSIVNTETLEVIGKRITQPNGNRYYSDLDLLTGFHNLDGLERTLYANDEKVNTTQKIIEEKPKGRTPNELDILENNLKIATVAKEEADAYLKRYKNNPLADKVTFNKAKLADAKRKIKRYTGEIENLKTSPQQTEKREIEIETKGEVSKTGRLTVIENFKENEVWNPKGETPLKEKEQDIIVSDTGLVIGNKKTDENNKAMYYLNSDLGRGSFNLDDLESRYFEFIDLADNLEKEIFEICKNSDDIKQALKLSSVLKYPQEASKIFFRKYYSRKNEVSTPQGVIEYIFNKVKEKQVDYVETSATGKLVVDSEFTTNNQGMEVRSIINTETLEVVGQRSTGIKNKAIEFYHNETSGDFISLNGFEKFLYPDSKIDLQRNVWIPAMTKFKLEKLLAKPTLTDNDKEVLLDFKYFMETQKVSAYEKGLMDAISVSQPSDTTDIDGHILLPKNKFWITNIIERTKDFQSNYWM